MPTVASGELIESALLELGVLAPGEKPEAQDYAFCLRKLQRIIDQFNARRECIFNVNFSRFTLKTNHAPHTIGPGGDFVTTVRPVRLVAANLVLTTSAPNIDLPIKVEDDAWWANQRVKDLTSTLPTHVYYSPDVPQGNLYFWPVPTVANDVRLELWSNLYSPVLVADKISMPQGYWEAIVNTLAVRCAPGFEKTPSPVLLREETKAMQVIESNNAGPPRISTAHGGLQNSGTRPRFNFLTGEPW